jgi:hypothetical protein
VTVLSSDALGSEQAKGGQQVAGSVHPSTKSITSLLRECVQRQVRRGGPGGQRRNKVETGVVITHQPSGIRAEASERRHVKENLPLALRRLRLALAVSVRVEAVSAPSSLWSSRCRGRRVVVSESHEDFPALLAEALDVLCGVDWNVGAAGERLGCSSSQLVRLLRRWRPALELLNRHREEMGERRMR